MARILTWLAALALTFVPGPARADETADATRAAQSIMRLFGEAKYEEVWSRHTSTFFRQHSTKEQFLASVTGGRAPLGALSSSKPTSIDHFDRDSASGFVGQIYSVTFANSYNAGQFLERIVVVKDPDGQFRLSGFWASDTPKK